MSKHKNPPLPGLEPIEILLRPRRAKVKPFTGKEKKDAIRRLVKRTPEVMVKVSGGGKTVKHVLAHVTYITRKGKLEALTDDHEKVSDKDEIKELMEEWGMNLTGAEGKNKLAFNVVFSMPAGTNAAKLHQAVKEFAKQEFFGERKYLMVLHEPDTDPSRKKAEHPHVHMVIQAEGYDGKRLYIRKATLEKWRDQFAEKLRDQGIEANATPRLVRGQTRKAKTGPIYALDETKRESTVRRSKLQQARQDVDQETRNIGPDGKPVPVLNAWDVQIAKKRGEVIEAFSATVRDLRREGDSDLATALEQFSKQLPSIQTERQQLAKFVRENVAQQRAANRGQPTQVAVRESTPETGKGKTPDKDRDR